MRTQSLEMPPLNNRRRNSRIETLRKCKAKKPPSQVLRIKRRHQQSRLLQRPRLLRAAKDEHLLLLVS